MTQNATAAPSATDITVHHLIKGTDQTSCGLTVDSREMVAVTEFGYVNCAGCGAAHSEVHAIASADGRFTACGIYLVPGKVRATYLGTSVTCPDCAAPEGPRFAETPEAIEGAARRLFWQDIPGGNFDALRPAAKDVYLTAARGAGF